MINNDDLDIFAHVKEQNPQWNDTQVWTDVSMQREIEDAVEKGIVDGNNITGEVFQLIVKKAHIWIERNLPDILEKVAGFFESLLSNIGEWISHGLHWIMNALGDLVSNLSF